MRYMIDKVAPVKNSCSNWHTGADHNQDLHCLPGYVDTIDVKRIGTCREPLLALAYWSQSSSGYSSRCAAMGTVVSGHPDSPARYISKHM